MTSYRARISFNEDYRSVSCFRLKYPSSRDTKCHTDVSGVEGVGRGQGLEGVPLFRVGTVGWYQKCSEVLISE